MTESARSDAIREDLESFARRLRYGTVVEALSPSEHRVRWQVLDRAGRTQVTALRSGLSLMTAHVSWERPWSLTVHQEPTPLKFILIRGEGPRVATGDADARRLASATVQVTQIKRPVDLRFDFGASAGTSHHSEIAIEVDPGRLCDLLGTTELPEVVNGILRSASAYPSSELSLTPGLSLLFDEITNLDVRSRSRQLYLEGKALELLGRLVDVLDEDERAPRLSPRDAEQVELARRLLLERLAEPPRLPELARCVGMSETKLKAGFRALFGSPIYTYLRARRMDEAQRLLRERRYTIMEVALRVGYSNPSKFAAAFRKHFGIPPARS